MLRLQLIVSIMAGFTALKDTSFGAKLTLRYLLALTLIAGVIIFSYFLLIQRLSLNDNDAYIINISGMQRMLSQRIALTAREVHDARSAEDADLYAGKMEVALERMIFNHRILTQKTMIDDVKAPMSETVKEMYFAENGIDAQVSEYTALGQQFLDVYREDGQDAVRESGLVFDIVKIARDGLLDKLNNVVSQYQKESEESIVQFRKLETLVMSVALCVLLLEVVFIFRPMVRSIVRTTRDLTDANKELVEFSYRISHDLRSPVISALGLGEMAQKLIKDGDIKTAQQSLEYSNASLRKMDSVIEDIITLTKIKNEDQKTEPVDLKNMIEESFDKISYLPNYDKMDVRIDVRFDGNIHVKAHALRQVLENLLSNTIKYADYSIDGSYVEVIAIKNDDICEISICDNGLGIEKKYRPKVFKMFQRFHPKISFGSGLGLYIVMQNIQVLDGEASYAPLEKGSKFTVKFPV